MKSQVPKILSAEDFLRRKFRRSQNILNPWLPKQGAAEIHGPRGLGKSHVALGIGIAVATGGTFLRWSAPRRRKVLLIDGEMPAALLQTWLAEAKAAAGIRTLNNLAIMADGLQGERLPRFSSYAALRYYAAIARPYDLLILDNLSSLAGRAGDMWSDDLQAWLLTLRRMGKTLLFLHHSGKNKKQRGTSHKEDNLDCVISLRRPVEYDERDGAWFEVHYEKHRHFFGDDAEPFEARLANGRWQMPGHVDDDHKAKMRILAVLGERNHTTTEIHEAFCGHLKGQKLNQVLSELEDHGMIRSTRLSGKGKLWFLVDLPQA